MTMSAPIEPSSSDERPEEVALRMRRLSSQAAEEAPEEATDSNALDQVAEELQSIQQDASDRMKQQRTAAGRWGRMNVLIGVPAALFSGAAGAIAALTDVSEGWKIAVTLLAVIASGLTGVATTLNASRRSQQAAFREAAYEALVRDARVTLKVDLERLSYATAREALETLIDRMREIDGLPSRESFYRERIAKRTNERHPSIASVSGDDGGNAGQY
jgi:hypothetical protein